MNKRIITASVAAIVLAFAGTLRADYNPLKLGWEDFSLYTEDDNVTNMEATAFANHYTNQNTHVALTGSWSSGEDFSDEVSTIVGGEFKLNTDGTVVTNTLLDAATLNAVLAGNLPEYDGGAPNGDVFIETTATFVPTDSLEDFTPEQGSDSDLKFAIYAYANEDVSPATTNLVVYHKYYDDEYIPVYTNDEIAVSGIDLSQPVDITTIIRKPYSADEFCLFKIIVEQAGTTVVLESEFGCSDHNADPDDPDGAGLAIADGGPWFVTANGDAGGVKDLSSLCFKGTGTISDIQVGIYTDGEQKTYAVDWTGSEKVVVSNGTEEVSGTSGSFAAGTVLVFYPTEGSIMNVTIGGAPVVGFASPYEYTVTGDATLVVLAGEEPTLYEVTWTASNVGATTNGVAVSTGSSFEAGTEITFTADTGYIITGVTGYVTDTPTNSFVYVVTSSASQSLTITASAETPSVPEWARPTGADQSVVDAYADWAAVHGKSEDLTVDHSAQFLMNVDATVSVVALTIDAIEITEEGTQITVGATGDNVGIDLEQINGVLNVYVAETLGVWEHKSIPAANLDYENNKAVVTIPATEGKFVKASVDYAEGEDGDIDEVAQP